jgi:hypothetical protein
MGAFSIQQGENMSWNYRVIRTVNKIPELLRKNNPDVGEFDIFYTIHDVYYDDNKDITNIGRESPVIGDDIDELKWVLQKMLEACDKPSVDYNTGEEV